MNAKQVTKALELNFECALKGIYNAILIEGIHGIGKSEIVRAAAASYKYYIHNGRLIDLRLAEISDVGELVGNPSVERDAGITKYYRPEWFPTEEPEIQEVLNNEDLSDEQKHERATEILNELREEGRTVGGIIFYDEMNRAKEDVRNACFQAILDRRMLVHPIPYGWVQVAAINPANDENYEVFELDSALLDRFCKLIYELEPEEWLDYAKGLIWEVLRQFLNKSQQFIGCKPVTSDNREIDQVLPSPRSWFKVNSILNVLTNGFQNIDIEKIKKHLDFIAGFVGDSVVPAFQTFLEKSTAIPLDGKSVVMGLHKGDTKKIIESWMEKKKDGELLHMSVITATCNNVLEFWKYNKVEDKHFRQALKNTMLYTMMIPKDPGFKLIQDLNSDQNDAEFKSDMKKLRDMITSVDDEIGLELGQKTYDNVARM